MAKCGLDAINSVPEEESYISDIDGIQKKINPFTRRYSSFLDVVYVWMARWRTCSPHHLLCEGRRMQAVFEI